MPDSPQLRIGDAERENALEALGEHMRVGRLDIDEYGDRAARVTAAKTRGELDEVFADLPEPHPRWSALVGSATGAVEPMPGAAAVRRDGRPGAQRFVSAMVPLSGLLALVLFITLDVSWLVFLLPVALAIVAGSIWGDDRKRHRD